MMLFEDLDCFTFDFFMKHWDYLSLKTPPQWSEPWTFKGPIPSGEQMGCIALFEKESIVEFLSIYGSKEDLYTSGNIKECLYQNILKTDKNPHPSFKHISNIRTISFDKEDVQLIPALRVYLEMRNS